MFVVGIFRYSCIYGYNIRFCIVNMYTCMYYMYIRVCYMFASLYICMCMVAIARIFATMKNLIDIDGWMDGFMLRRRICENVYACASLIDVEKLMLRGNRIWHRMWEFGVGLFMISIAPDSLLLPSIYGFVEDMAIVTLGLSVGKWVDDTHRLMVSAFLFNFGT